MKPRGGWGPAETRISSRKVAGAREGHHRPACIPGGGRDGTKQDTSSRWSVRRADTGRAGETAVLGEGDAPDQATLF